MKLKSSALIVAIACLLSVGCGGPAPVTLVPTTGVVKINGKPAAGIMVQFSPDIIDETVSATTSQAVTNDAGEFDLFSLSGERGAMEGPHRVSLFDTLEERPAQGEVANNPSRLDPKYASGGIKVEVVKDKPIEIEATGP